MTVDPANPDPHTQAAELALGLLDRQERAAAMRRILSDPDFAQDVAWWRDRFSHLLDDYEPVAPEADLLPDVGEAPRASPPSPSPRPWRWFAGGMAGGALAASLAALTVLPVRSAPPVVAPAPQPAPLIAVLVPSGAGGQAPVAAWLTRSDGALRLTADIAVPRNRSAELWSIGSDKTPRALGLLSPADRSLIGSAARLNAGDTLAISIEPEGGSRTGAPTGPVVVAGVLTTV